MTDSSCIKGLRLLNTRPKGQGDSLTKAIKKAGGKSIELPVIDITPLTLRQEWLIECLKANNALFVSTNAAELFFKSLEKYALSWPQTIQTFSVGKATSILVQKFTATHSVAPLQENSEGLLALPGLQNVQGQTIALIKGEGGRSLICKTLTRRGAKVIELDMYRRAVPKYSKTFIESFWQANPVDIILFTSQTSVKNLFELLGQHATQWIQNKPCIVNSLRVAGYAKLKGIKTIHICNYNEIVKTLSQLHPFNDN